jgi:DNA polymerase-3 subunit alpha
MSGFFQCKNYYIPSYDEMIAFGNTEEELTNTLEIAEKCEEYTNILGPPILPPFKTPNKETPSELFISLCQDGWNRKILPLIDEKDLPVYKDRLDEELQVLQDAGLASYFLIIWDILNYVRNQGWLPGPGRGSASGCLISYLLDITQVDPIKYNLVFERFYSKGRNLKSSVSFEEFSYNKFVFGV